MSILFCLCVEKNLARIYLPELPACYYKLLFATFRTQKNLHCRFKFNHAFRSFVLVAERGIGPQQLRRRWAGLINLLVQVRPERRRRRSATHRQSIGISRVPRRREVRWRRPVWLDIRLVGRVADIGLQEPQVVRILVTAVIIVVRLISDRVARPVQQIRLLHGHKDHSRTNTASTRQQPLDAGGIVGAYGDV
jgi:hypothetical protein